ncbi:hypothetical protein A6R68_00047 [Neotoma lepida]|uniref:Uncharacterized protein n=1 Tax=Neotoma lepida TaxID=56216 RepID=A0A1A6GZ39_NEOLE|nr:hypothetical protein A6R68_00047 [Neotoma lepida]
MSPSLPFIVRVGPQPELTARPQRSQGTSAGPSTGTGDGFSMGLQQAVVQGPYRDQIRQAGLTAWAKLDKGPMESPIAGVRQKPNETLPEFIDRIVMPVVKLLLATLVLLHTVNTAPRNPHQLQKVTWVVISAGNGEILNGTTHEAVPGAWWPGLYFDLCDLVRGSWDIGDWTPAHEG